MSICIIDTWGTTRRNNPILSNRGVLWDPEISTTIIVPHMYAYECVNVGILLIFQLVVKSENEKEARRKKSVVELEVKYLGL